MKFTIVGGGFAGVKLALELAKDTSNQITIITERDTFQYYPTLYNSATGRGSDESWTPLGLIFGDYDNVHVVLDKVIGIDHKKKQLVGLSEERYDYSTLAIAVGMVTTYFGIPGMDQYAYGIKSAGEISALKQRIARDLVETKQLDQNYVVIGGGPTGTELAGALGDYLRRAAKQHGVKRPRVNIRLIEAAPRVLPRSHEKVSARVTRRLEKLGVEVQTGTAVEKATAESVIAGGRPIASHSVIWTSGVTNSPLFAAHPELFRLAPNGKVIVNERLQAARNIYVLGDNAATQYSGLAQTALYDASFVASNIRRQKNGKKAKDYKPKQPISIIPVGESWAALEWHWIRLYGRLATMLRRLGDLHGYMSFLSPVQALRPWMAATVYERQFFAPIRRSRRRAISKKAAEQRSRA